MGIYGVKPDERVVRFPFDAQSALTEAINIERVMTLHLARCDDHVVAVKLANIFGGLARQFDKKSVELREIK